MATRRLSLSEFERAVSVLDLQPTQKSRAKRVLVDGMSRKEVASDDNVTYETVRSICQRVLTQANIPNEPVSEQQFIFAVSKMPRLTDKNKKLIRQVCVENKDLASVAKKAGISRSNLNQKVLRVRENIVPYGWRYVSGILPDKQADEVEAMFNKALANEDID